MKQIRIITVLAYSVFLLPPTSHAAEEYFGLIESRPKTGDIGSWVIGGRTVEVTNKTVLDEDNGPFVVGACVEIELNGKVAIDISTEEKRLCRK